MSETSLALSVKWQIIQSRITVFYSDDAIVNYLGEWWEDALAVPLLRDETRNLEGIRLVGGLVGDKQWTASANPNRADFILQSNVPPPERGAIWHMSSAPGLYNQAARGMVGPVCKWIDCVKGINRLAVGAMLLAPGPDLDDAYTILSACLPDIRFDHVEAPDFTFRINRRRKSTRSPTITINRLATWSIAQGQAVEIAASIGGRTSQSNLVQYAANLEIDINTAPVTPGSIPNDQSRNLLNELVELAVEITEKGDVP